MSTPCKGRGRHPCEVRIGISDDGHVVLRTLDESGLSPLVALLSPVGATELCNRFSEQPTHCATPK